MFRFVAPTAFAVFLALPATAQQAEPIPTPPPSAPEAQPGQDNTVPMPVLPTQSAGCSSTRQLNS